MLLALFTSLAACCWIGRHIFQSVPFAGRRPSSVQDALSSAENLALYCSFLVSERSVLNDLLLSESAVVLSQSTCGSASCVSMQAIVER